MYIFPTHSGIGLIFFCKTRPKKAILRTNAHELARGNTKSRVETLFFPSKRPVFFDICDFHSYPTDMPTHREMFWCIGIMDFCPKSRVGVVPDGNFLWYWRAEDVIL